MEHEKQTQQKTRLLGERKNVLLAILSEARCYGDDVSHADGALRRVGRTSSFPITINWLFGSAEVRQQISVIDDLIDYPDRPST